MALTLICQNQTIAAEALDDAIDTDRKVMLAQALPVGAIVELVGEGFFRVKRVLAPAAPRTWRAYLEAETTVQRLDLGDQSIPVVALTDDPMAVKVMVVADLEQAPVAGTTVHYGQQAYTIQRALAPAAPRGWRFYLQAVGVAVLTTQPVATPEITIPEVPVADPVVHASENLEAVFIVEVEKLGGTNIRRSSTTLRVPYTRLSEELQRILRAGGKVVSITEGSLLR